MSRTLQGKVALITGGSRGLGAAIANAFVAEGADVAFSYLRSRDKATALAAELGEKGSRVLAIASDQGDTEAAKPLIDKVITHFGKLDILVNNAAVVAKGQKVDAPDLDISALDRQWQINVMGAVATTRAAAPMLANGGRIIFIGSSNGTLALSPGVADYAGTKAALIGYAKGVARDLGARDITVNVVQPGAMPTDMMAEAMGSKIATEAFLDMHPIRRVATLEEVSALVCFLAGPHGGYITGGVIDVAGGVGI